MELEAEEGGTKGRTAPRSVAAGSGFAARAAAFCNMNLQIQTTRSISSSTPASAVWRAFWAHPP